MSHSLTHCVMFRGCLAQDSQCLRPNLAKLHSGCCTMIQESPLSHVRLPLHLRFNVVCTACRQVPTSGRHPLDVCSLPVVGICAFFMHLRCVHVFSFVHMCTLPEVGMGALFLCRGMRAHFLCFACHGEGAMFVLSSHIITAGTSLSGTCRLCLVCQLSHC